MAKVRAAEAPLVVAGRPVDVLEGLQEVLRAAERDGAARREGQVARQGHGGAGEGQHDVVAEVEGRRRRLVGVERLQVIQPVKDQLVLRHHAVRPGVCQVGQEVVVEVLLPGVKAGERAEGVCAGEQILA